MNGMKIIKESFKVLILGSLLSSIGGLSLDFIRMKLSLFTPLIIVLPALTDMIGDAGTIVVSKITTYLYLGKFKKEILPDFVKKLFLMLIKLFSLSAVYVTFLALFIGYLKGFNFNILFLIKMLIIVLLTTLSIMIIIFSVALIGGRYTFKRNIDPDDMLIPLTTSIADLGSLIIFSLLVFYFFYSFRFFKFI